MPVMKVPAGIAKDGMLSPAGAFQENQYGKQMRVCTSSLKDGVFRETITGKEFTKGDLNPQIKKRKK